MVSLFLVNFLELLQKVKGIE
jgi:solute carrier family 8 (sodium/calcium exchanger)